MRYTGMRLTRTRDSQNRYQQYTRRDSIAARKQFTVTSQALAPDHREPRLSTSVTSPFIPNTSSVSSQGLPAQISHYYHSVPTRCVTATGSYGPLQRGAGHALQCSGEACTTHTHTLTSRIHHVLTHRESIPSRNGCWRCGRSRSGRVLL